MPPSGATPADPPSRAAQLADEPGAARSARDCAWVSGTGHCRRRDCGEACVFRAQRVAEAGRVARWRRLRRMFVGRQLR